MEPTTQSVSRRRNHVGTFSLLAAVGGAVGCRLALTVGGLVGSTWLAAKMGWGWC